MVKTRTYQSSSGYSGYGSHSYGVKPTAGPYNPLPSSAATSAASSAKESKKSDGDKSKKEKGKAR